MEIIMILELSLDGKTNIDLAKKFQNGFCYRGIYNHGKRIGQLEVVIDYGEKGYTIINEKSGLIVVVGVELKDFDKVLHQLKRLGFSGFVGVSHDQECSEAEWFDPNFFVFVKI